MKEFAQGGRLNSEVILIPRDILECVAYPSGSCWLDDVVEVICKEYDRTVITRKSRPLSTGLFKPSFVDFHSGLMMQEFHIIPALNLLPPAQLKLNTCLRDVFCFSL